MTEFPRLRRTIPQGDEVLQLVKDVRYDGHGRFWSLTADPAGRLALHRDWWVQYFPGRWVSGLHGPLFITARPQDDFYIIRDRQVWSIERWSILAWNVRPISVGAVVQHLSEQLHRFWKEYPRFQGRQMYLPSRVHVADRVMLMKRLR